MRLTLFFISFLLVATPTVLAQENTVTIKGSAPEYATYNLVLQTITNPITGESAELAVFQVDENGLFDCQIEINQITYASIDAGRYRGNIYLEPGKTYELILPPFEPRTDAERFNPFFVPEDVVLGIANEEAQALNKAIIQFDNDLKQLYDENAVRIFSRSDVTKAHEIISELDSLYPAKAGSYLSQYKSYAYGELKSIAYKRQKRRLIEEVFTASDLNVFMPSFKTAFNIVFNSFFTSYFSSNHGQELKDAYNKEGGFDTLSIVIQKDPLFENPELAEVVLLKGLYDAFYSGRYNEAHIINLFKQAESTGSTGIVRELAIGLYKKVNALRAGTKAPPFTLYRLDGKEKSLSDYEGKFVYLSFIHTENHACRQDLQLLEVIAKRMKRDVSLVTIILDEDPTIAQQMVKANKYKWDFLHYALMPKVVLDYNIKAVPIYYVIDPEGKLRLTPAPSPGENFGPAFMEAVRNYNYEQLRRDKPKEKSIYDF